jgi:threonine dehydratase
MDDAERNMDFKNYPISLAEVITSRAIIGRHLGPAPLRRYEGLSRLLEAEVYVKHENHNPTGTFKIRGGVNVMHHLRAGGVKGVITYSTGNHGTSVATAARWFGLEAVIVVPENSNPVKVQAIRETGAELIEAGADFEEAGRVVDRLREERGLYYVHPANEPLIINGVGTEFLEICEELPGLEVIIVPLGAGSEAASAVTVIKSLRPEVEIVAVQAEQSRAAWESWRGGRIVTSANETFAGGVATGTAYELPFGIYSRGLADFVLLSETELDEGIGLALHHTRNLVEAAGGAALRAAFKIKDRLQGRRVVLQMSGCNAAPEEIRRGAGTDCLATGRPL